jgi:hypothetical protein
MLLCLRCKVKRGKKEMLPHIASSTLSSDQRKSSRVQLHRFLKSNSTPRVPIAVISNPLDSIQCCCRMDIGDEMGWPRDKNIRRGNGHCKPYGSIQASPRTSRHRRDGGRRPRTNSPWGKSAGTISHHRAHLRLCSTPHLRILESSFQEDSTRLGHRTFVG